MRSLFVRRRAVSAVVGSGRNWRLLLPALLLLAGAGSSPLARAADESEVSRQSNLVELHSHAGLLEVTLTAAPGRVHIGGLELDGAVYNGIYTGPVLRVLPGDMLRVHLVNRLAHPTNLHFHGIRTSPLGNSDNVHLAIAPGTSFTYEVRIPASQPPGVYWYHSHVHGLSEPQVMGGLSGTLIVDSPAAAAPTPLPVERIFVLKDMTFDDDTGDKRIDDELHGVIQSIDGQLETSLRMRPGETQLWRFTNQSANRIFHLNLSGHRFRILAADGEPVLRPLHTDRLDISPASRFDVLVTADAPGEISLVSEGVMTGSGAARKPDRVLARLTVAGVAVEPSPAWSQNSTAPPRDLRGALIDASRVVVFSQTKTLDPAKQVFFLNGRTFDAGRVDFRVPLGHVEEWTIRNESDDMHVFHIHQLSFQVVEVNGLPVPFDGRVDTVRIPERGEVKLRMAFEDPRIVGRFMFHCHVLKHEDKGMMAQIEVYDPREPSLLQRARLLYSHVWWWIYGVPWTMCGFANA